MGPTAVGKTTFAINLAKRYNTQIISADSRQCFKELNIGVARPSIEELNLIRHYFIASHSIDQEINAGIYEKYALKSAGEILANNKIALMVGGTGLYINAFCNGIDEVPEVAKSVRNDIIENYTKKGLMWLQNQVQIKDPKFWLIAEQQNPQRLMRALEVIETTGKSINSFKKNIQIERPFNIIKLGLELPREQLINNINTRVDKMVEEGLIEEVASLIPYKHLNALQTVGYKEIFEYFDGKITKQQAIEKIKISTRQYAKRQMTWFKKDVEINWILPTTTLDIDNLIQKAE